MRIPDASAIEALARKYELALVVLFGSSANDTTHAWSDVDLAIQRADGRPVPRGGWAVLEPWSDFAKAFETEELDLVDLVRCPAVLACSALAPESRILFEGASDVFVDAATRAFLVAADERPILEASRWALAEWVRDNVRS